MPSPSDRPPTVGTLAEYNESPLERTREWAGEGDVVSMTGPDADHHLLFHPAHVERVLFDHHEALEKHMVGQTQVATKSVGSVYGDQWRAQRSAQQPAFRPERVRSYCGTFQSVAEDLVAAMPVDERVDVHRRMKRTSIRMIARALYGVDAVDDRIVESSDAITDWHHAKSSGDDIPASVQDRFDDVYATLVEWTESVIAERKADPGGDDLVSTLVALGPDGAAGYTDDRIRDELIAKLFSAHRTTSQSWTYSLYLLSGAPAVERRLLAELEAVVGGGAPGQAHVDDLAYTEHVVREALRLHPPAPTLTRRVTSDLRVGEYTLPAGDVVYFPMVEIHRDGRWWDDPDQFRPARFEGDQPRHPFAYFPFGVGPRRCPGEDFALAEAKVVVGALLNAFHFERASDTVSLLPGRAGVLDRDDPLYLIPRSRT